MRVVFALIHWITERSLASTPMLLLCARRFNGATKERIITAKNINWLSGHTTNAAGTAYQFAYIGGSYHGTDWVLSTDLRGR